MLSIVPINYADYMKHGDAKVDRLRGLKRSWDPDNVFRLNHNIEPA